jgi:hypothetical protein
MPIAGESLVKIQRIVNDAGEPRCWSRMPYERCEYRSPADCLYARPTIDGSPYSPGPSCPVWHGDAQSKCNEMQSECNGEPQSRNTIDCNGTCFGSSCEQETDCSNQIVNSTETHAEMHAKSRRYTCIICGRKGRKTRDGKKDSICLECKDAGRHP